MRSGRERSRTTRSPTTPAKALHAAAKAAGESGYGAQWAGQGAPLARSMPAATLVAELRSEMERVLSGRHADTTTGESP